MPLTRPLARYDSRSGAPLAEVSSWNLIDLVSWVFTMLHRQGCYNEPGSIVVLAAYLGQIPKIRRKLQDVVKIIVDERDLELLEEHGIDEEATTTPEDKLSQQVLIRLALLTWARTIRSTDIMFKIGLLTISRAKRAMLSYLA